MFVRYADNHQGICIGFAWQDFNLEFHGSCPPQPNIPRKVHYNSKLIFQGCGTCEHWLQAYTTKQPLPQHTVEREWRMLYKKGRYQNERIRQAIKEIIFGCNINEQHRQQVISLVSDLKEIKFSNSKLA